MPACDFRKLTLNYILSRTVFEISQITGQIFAVDRECLCLTHSLLVQAKSLNLGLQIGFKKRQTSFYGKCKAYFDILNHLGVTHEGDRQTDGQTSSVANATFNYLLTKPSLTQNSNAWIAADFTMTYTTLWQCFRSLNAKQNLFTWHFASRYFSSSSEKLNADTDKKPDMTDKNLSWCLCWAFDSWDRWYSTSWNHHHHNHHVSVGLSWARSTQPCLPPGSLIEYQLRLG